MQPVEPLTPRSRFPVGQLPRWVRDYVEAEAHVLQVDPVVVALSVLGATALVMQGKAEIGVRGDWVEPLSLWVMTALRSGNRKSSSLLRPLEPLRAYESEENAARAEYRQRLAEREASLSGKGAERARRVAELKAAAPPDLQLFGGDLTPEAIALALAEQGESYAVVTDEPVSLSAVLGGVYSEGKSNPGIYMAGYSGSPYRRRRVKSPSVDLARPALSLLLCGQPAVFNDLAAQERLIEVGFAGRFLLALPEDQLGYRAVHSSGVPEEVRDLYRLNMRAICTAPEPEPLPDVRGSWVPEHPEPWPAGPRKRRRLLLTPEARELHRQTEERIEPLLRQDAPLGELSDFGAKLAGNIARCAGLLHALEHPESWGQETVGVATMELAIEIGRFALGQVLTIFGEGARARADEAMANYVHQRAQKLGANGAAGIVGWSALSRSLVQGNGRGRIRDTETLQALVAILEERGALTRDLTYTRGKRWLVRREEAEEPRYAEAEA